ncbi:MAG: THUMP domain-containing protein [Candidatus Hermodarchaeota archaeon]
MNEYKILPSYNLIKINLSPEIWLKSMKVRIRMTKTLMRNVKKALNKSGVNFHKFQLSKDTSRVFFFFNNKDINNAMMVLNRVFGIESYSPALRTSNRMKNITERTIEVCKEILRKNDTFALRVKRSGVHEYSSLDVAQKVGKAVLENFPNLNLKVNLTNPNKVIYIEVRDEFSYIFTDVLKTQWEGLPIEGYNKIMCMDVGRLNDLLASFLLMRRGCELYPVLFLLTDDDKAIESRLFNWKEVLNYMPFSFLNVRIINLFRILEQVKDKIQDQKNICAICRTIRFDIISRILNDNHANDLKGIKAISDGINLYNLTKCPDEVDLQSIAINYLFSQYPIFTPIIAFDEPIIKNFLSMISIDLKTIEYCYFRPKNQEINKQELKTLYKSLNLKDLILDTLKEMKLIKLS